MDCPFITFLCFLRKTPIRNYEIDALNPNKWFLKLAMTLFDYHPFILRVLCLVILLLLKFAMKYKSCVQYSHKIYKTEKGFVNSFLRMKTSFPSLLVREKVFSMMRIHVLLCIQSPLNEDLLYQDL